MLLSSLPRPYLTQTVTLILQGVLFRIVRDRKIVIEQDVAAFFCQVFELGSGDDPYGRESAVYWNERC